MTRRVSFAFVDFLITIDSFVSWIAETNVFRYRVLTFTIETRIAGTLVNVDFTVRTYTTRVKCW